MHMTSSSASDVIICGDVIIDVFEIAKVQTENHI